MDETQGRYAMSSIKYQAPSKDVSARTITTRINTWVLSGIFPVSRPGILQLMGKSCPVNHPAETVSRRRLLCGDSKAER